MLGYTYEIEVLPYDGGSPINVGTVTAGSIREAVPEVCRRVASHMPPLDLDNKYRVKTDDPDWTNDQDGSVGACVPKDREDKHPKGGVLA